MSTFYLGEVARLPAMYRQELSMAFEHNVSGRALVEELIVAERKMLKEIAELEKRAAEIWGRYAM